MAEGRVRVRRIYEEPEPEDGIRVLVDRIWPRGLTKAKAKLDEWCKHVAPSDELRNWYGHDPGRFEEFGRRYRLELQDPTQAEAQAHLRGLAEDRQLTLLTATRQPEISEAAVLATLLQSQQVWTAGPADHVAAVVTQMSVEARRARENSAIVRKLLRQRQPEFAAALSSAERYFSCLCGRARKRDRHDDRAQEAEDEPNV